MTRALIILDRGKNFWVKLWKPLPILRKREYAKMWKPPRFCGSFFFLFLSLSSLRISYLSLPKHRGNVASKYSGSVSTIFTKLLGKDSNIFLPKYCGRVSAIITKILWKVSTVCTKIFRKVFQNLPRSVENRRSRPSRVHYKGCLRVFHGT